MTPLPKGKRMLNRKILVSAVGFGLVLSMQSVGAVQLDYSIDLGIEHSDNINLSADDPVSQNVLIPGIDFSFNQVGSTVQARAAGRIEYRDYLQGAFGNEFRGQLSGLFNWVIAPQRLAFSVEDYASEQPVNTLSRNTPTNLQQTNVFAAGPTLSFRLGETVRGQAELRYIDSAASKTKEFNSQRGFAALRALKDLNPTDQISGNLEIEHVAFDQGTASDQIATGANYDSYKLFGRYVSKLAHFNIDAALGWSDFTFARGLPDQSGVLARANVDWQASARSTFGLGLARQFGDATQDLVVDPTQIGSNISSITNGNNQITPQVFLENRVDASYAFNGQRVSLRVAPYYRRQSYDNEPDRNETAHGGSASIDYLLGPNWTLGFAAGEETSRYTSIDRRDEILSYGPYVTQQISQHWSWRLNVTHDQRTSTAADQGYNENLVFFVLSYKR